MEMEPSTETEPNNHDIAEIVEEEITNEDEDDDDIVPVVLRGMGLTDELNDDDEQTYGYAAEILNSCALPMVLNATIEMGALEIIVKEAGQDGLSPGEITAKIEASNPEASDMLDRMLRMLATYNVVRCRAVLRNDDGSVERRYGPGPVAKCFVQGDEYDGSLATMLKLVLDPVYLASWSRLKEAVLDGGIPFNKVHKKHVFEYARVNPKFNETFNSAMYGESTRVIWKILDKYNGFKDIQKLVDVGGGLGHAISIIIYKYPNIKGIHFDLPHVLEHSYGVPGVEQISGDMFESVPEGDAIFMKGILHCWSDDRCVALLKNCYKALPEDGGKVIVVETNIEEEPDTTPYAKGTSLLDVSMMTQCPGGKERTRREFEALAKAAGFTSVKGDWCVSNVWVMEFYK